MRIKQIQLGFTLFEIVITLAVASILIGVAVPSFNSMSKSNNMTSTVNDLVYALNIARSEAMKSNSASVCVSSDQATCTTGAWTTGWIVFNDLNGNCTVDAGENVIKAVEATPNLISISVAPTDSCVTYAGNGFITPPGDVPLAFSFCDDRTGPQVGRTVNLIITGRPATTPSAC